MILRKLSELFKPPRRRRIRRRRVRSLRCRRFSNIRAQLQDAREGRRVRLKPLPIGVLAQQQRMNRILDWLDLDLMSQPF
jgi:hypothetical protein